VKRIAFGLDGVAVLVFVAIGRSVHQHGINLAGVASTLWPFAAGLGAAWLVVLATHQNPSQLLAGAEITLLTVGVGMTLRVIAGQGTALAFILVALGFLGATMALSRVITRALHRRLRPT